MKVIPAIDLMKGKVVRLTKGDPEKATFYHDMGTPVEIAQRWKDQGAERLHIIDLDAAFGKPDNLKTVTQIAKTTSLSLQVGGGIRSVAAAERLLKAGMTHVILGSLALKKPSAISALLDKFDPERIIVALDNKDGMVMVEGWTSSTSYAVMEALTENVKLGVKTFLITSISRDGTLSGPDLETLKEGCRFSGVKLIAAGGIGDLRDLVLLSHTGVWGVVVGKALYEGKFTLQEAIKTVEKESKECH